MTALEPLTERQLDAIVRDLLRHTGWEVFHTYRSVKSRPGYPDLSCWRDRHLWLELKSAGGRLSRRQQETIRGMLAAGDEVYVIREADLADLAAVLGRNPMGVTGAAARLSARTRAEVDR